MARDILIVDDDKNALANYGNRIKIALGIEPFLAYDPGQALNILRVYSIKVLVTDEDMQAMRGTELVRQVREELGLDIPCIMFTGFAHKVDMTEAIKLRNLKFLDKTNVLRLPDEVSESLRNYAAEIARHSGMPINKILSKRRRFIMLNSEVIVTLVRVVSIDEYSRDNEWQTIYRAERGKGVKTESVFRAAVRASWEIEAGADVSSRLGVRLRGLGADLDAALETRTSQTVRQGLERNFELTTTETVDVEPIKDPPPRSGLRAREYQYAPVHLRLILELEVRCSCCGSTQRLNEPYDVPTDRIALRVREYFDTSPTEDYYTGFLTGKLATGAEA